MLNTLSINSWYVNNHEDLINESSSIESSSFYLWLFTKYWFKSNSWIFFNFNSICIENKKYWNILLDHDFDDIPEIEVYKYWNSLKNWWVIYDRRYKEKKFNISIKIMSDSIENLENEIRDLKTLLEIWWEFYKVEKENTLKINIKLEDIEVWRLILSWTEIKIKAISMDPFWKTSNSITIFNEWNIWSFSWTINLTNTNIKWFLKHIIFLRTITWVINSLTLTLWGFPIKINWTFNSWDYVILDWIESKAFLNWNKTKFYWQFPELEINNPYSLTVTFLWGWTVDEFDLYNIYENKQL